ncbi:MAG TPA: pyridoxal-dependent decarboxylase [Magnetospirillaceae bacterium]|jgi:glutamate/tyrosine decarboxylase-like PLP-dependent enzyme
MSGDTPKPDKSLLDPADWDAFRSEAHALLDQMIGHLQHAGEGPVWQPLPDAAKNALATPSPKTPSAVETLRSELGQLIQPYVVGNTHPRFWGWVHGTGTPGGMLAEMAAAALNANCGGRNHVGIELERIVVDWARSWFGLPDTAGGLLVSGSSMANLLALAIARHHKAGHDVRALGNGDAKLVAYASSEAHLSVSKAFEVLGLGRAALRSVPIDADLRMDVAALRKAIAADRAAGQKPFAVIANTGSVNSGAFDDLNAIADLCKTEGLWLHVDGAFGALVMLNPTLASRAAGIERADSIAFDFHKWLHVPYDAGCVLVRDKALQIAAFGGRPDYLASIGGLGAGEAWPSDLGIELSRGFRALKVWWTIKEHGTARLGEAIARNCAQAKLFEGLLRKNPAIEVLAPVSLNIVCCRYRAPGLDDKALDDLNARIIVAIQESGVAVPSSCRIGGKLAIRVCITNHRSRDSDFVLMAETIAATGSRLAKA